MILSFTRPELLLLLPLAGAALWLSARVSYADLPGYRRALAWALRALLIAALVFALAGARWMRPTPGVEVVFVSDQSASVAPAERERALQVVREALPRRRAADVAALVACGREALVESESLTAAAGVRLQSTISGTHSNLAAGLRLALGLIPAEKAGRIVLLSDGNENLGQAGSEALVARANGVPIDVVPLQTQSHNDVVVRSLHLPAEARRGEPLAAQAAITATAPTRATLRVLVDGRPVSSRQVTLAAGSNLLREPVVLGETGFHRVELLLDAAGETCRANDLAAGFVRVRGRPRVLMVDQHPRSLEPLCRALRGQGIEVVSGGPPALPTNPADLEGYDALILRNVASYQMTYRQMSMIRSAVREGGLGLGMIGGEYSFGAGGYFDTPIEEALPVSMDLRKDRQYLASATIIVMDTSGSMGMAEDGVEKIQLAAEASCAVADLLLPYDALGLLVSDPSPTLVSPIAPLTQREAIKAKMRSLQAGGGGICVRPSLAAARVELARVKSPVRHIILLADGSDCDDQQGAVDLVRQMAAERITTTAIAFGDGPHVPFLRDVVKAGGGHFYLTARGRDLKGIFTREIMTMEKAAVIEERFLPRVKDASPVLSGLPALPPLLGYVAASIKPRATEPLETHKQDPLFAHWQYGLGRAFAFTSDACPHWAVEWVAWPGFARFWAQAVRWVLRQLPAGDLHPEVELRGDRAHVRVLALREEKTRLDGLEVRASLRRPDDEVVATALPQTGPGCYEGDLPVDQVGSYVCSLTARGPDGYGSRQVCGFAIPYPPDLADTSANELLLRELAESTGGKVLQRPEEAFRRPSRVPRTPVDITALLLWLAALLLPLDVAARRLAMRREDFLKVWVFVLGVLGRVRPPPREAAPERETVNALLARKREVRGRPGASVAPAVLPPSPPSEAPPAAPETPPASPRAPEAPPAAPPAQPSAPAGEEGDTASRLLQRKRQLRERR